MIVLARNAIRQVSPGVFSVELTQGKFALVDRADLELVAAHRWSTSKKGRTFYAITNVRRRDGSWTMLTIHRIILADAEEVDHINGDGLDNRRMNLRASSRAENMRNTRKPRNNTSGFKGVCWDRDHARWRSYIQINGRLLYLGLFDDLEVAARAYDTAARAHFGAFAALNFPAEGERAAIEMAS